MAYGITGASLYNPNAFLEGANAQAALAKISAADQASRFARGGNNADAVSTLNNAGMYDQANDQAAAPDAVQRATTETSQKEANLAQTQQSTATSSYSLGEKQHEDELAKVNQVASYLKKAQANGQDPNAVYGSMHDYLTNTLGLPEDEYQQIGEHLKSTPGFLDTIYNQSLKAIGNRMVDTNTGKVVVDSPAGGAAGKPNIQKDANGQLWQIITDPDGNAHYQPVTAEQAAAAGGQPATAVPGQTAFPVGPNDAMQALQVALAEDSKNPAAVLSVIMNRKAKTGTSVGDILRAPLQFESVGNGSAAKISPAQVTAALAAQPELNSILQGQVPDQYKDFTNFYAPGLQAADGRKKPAWDDGTGTKIGSQLYFKSGPIGTERNPVGLPGQYNPSTPGAAATAQPTFATKQPKGVGGAPVNSVYAETMADAVMNGGQDFLPKGSGPVAAAQREAVIEAGKAKYGDKFNIVSSTANYKANQTALNAATKQTDLANGFEKATEAAAGLIGIAPKSIHLTGTGPLIDEPILEGQIAMGNKDAAAYKNYVDSFADEYAKVITSSTTGQGATDAANRRAHSRINAAFAKGEMQNVIHGMITEMQTKVKAQQGNVTDIANRLSAGQNPGTASTPAGNRPSLSDIFKGAH